MPGARRAPRSPSVLLVTGAYYPEISAAGLQCRTVAAALGGRVRFGVLATAVDPALPAVEIMDGVTVYRVPVDVRRLWSKMSASARLIARLFRIQSAYDIVHLHGFSQKNVPVMWLARLAGKPIVLTLHTAGQDEPEPVRRRGAMAYRAFTSAQLILAVSPTLRRACLDAGLPPDRVRLTPNGIDTRRFRPVEPSEKAAIRRDLRLPADVPIVLFVGFFSRDKRPDVLFRAWQPLAQRHGIDAALVFVGETEPTYFEIDDALAREIRAGASAGGRSRRVLFVEPTLAIEKYFQAADVFVLPSIREAHPVALLEAMACGLPSVASRLPGATDAVIEDGVNGRLVPADDEPALTSVLCDLLQNPAQACMLGARARDTIASRFDVRQTAETWVAAYDHVLGP